VPKRSTQHRSQPLIALGEAIRRSRKAQGITQERLALLAEVDRSYMGRVERGDNNVAVLTLIRLANALQITVAQLMEEAQL